MRDHAIVSPHFWTGDTGRQLRKDPDAQRIAFYLMTCPSANMIGLYYLPVPLICHEVGVSEQGAIKALRRLSEAGFCAYDAPSEVVFVKQMARYQVGEVVHEGDKRLIGVERMLLQMRNSCFYNEFLERYREIFHLKLSPKPSPSIAPPQDHGCSYQDQEQDQEQGQDKEQDLPPTPTPAPPVSVREEKRLQVVSQRPGVFTTAYTPGFLAWWEEYPHDKRAAKPKCFAVWVEKRLEARQEELVEKLVRLKQTTWNRTGAERRYIKTALPYLNDGRYDDELMALPTFDPVEANQISAKGLRGVQAAQRIMHATQEAPYDAEGPTTFLPSPQCYGRVLQ